MDFIGFLYQRQPALLWTYLFSGFFYPIFLSASPCQQSLIDQCGRLITGFTPQKYLSGLVLDTAIRDDCEAFASVRLCNDKVLRPCLAAELVTLDPFIRQANEFISLFCENDQFRRDYAHHGQCLAAVQADINLCINNYGLTVSDIASISDSLAPQEVLHRSCCDGLHRLTACSFAAAVRKCHPSSADFVKKFLYKMMKSTLQDWIARQCFEYQTQCPREPILEEPGRISMPPLGNKTTFTEAPGLPSDETVSTTTTQPFPTGKESSSSSSPILTSQASITNSVTKEHGMNELSTDGAGSIMLSHSRPVARAGELGPRSSSLQADDALPNAGVVVSGVGAAIPGTSTEVTSSSRTYRPANNRGLPERPAMAPGKLRAKNFGADVHPLARKFLLVISTIAFLCGWY